MAEKAENMYEWPDSEGKQVLCHSAHAKRVTSMTLDHTTRTYPCRQPQTYGFSFHFEQCKNTGKMHKIC